MRIKLSQLDWESLVKVTSKISATKLSLVQILRIQDVVELVGNQLRGFFTEREKLIDVGQRFLDAHDVKLQALYKKYGADSNHPEIKQLNEDGRKQLDNEINAPIKKSGDVMLEIDLPDNLFAVLKDVYSKEVTFGENGYMDNEAGKAAFARSVKAMGITEADLTPPPPANNTAELTTEPAK